MLAEVHLAAGLTVPGAFGRGPAATVGPLWI